LIVALFRRKKKSLLSVSFLLLLVDLMLRCCCNTALSSAPPHLSIRVLRRQLSTRSSSLHQHISHLDSTQPTEPFRPSRLPRLSEAPLAMVNRSLISHVQACDLFSFSTSALDILNEIDCTIRLPLARTSSQGTPTNDMLSPAPHSPRLVGGAHSGWWREASSHNLASPALAAWGFGRVTAPPGAPAPLPAWANTSLLEPFSRVLVHLLLQTAESMHCPQFELRRISTMVSLRLRSLL
jgi:hypothetical protein